VRTLYSIQYLRALAVLAVVSYHAGQWVLSPVVVGAAGVDIFFIISGFVMWTATWNQPADPLEFLRRRVVRIVPLYWLATVALALGVLLMPGVIPNVTLQGAHLAKSLLFIPHVNPQGYPFPFLAVGWTLNYEVIFYLAFAAALSAGREHRLAVLTWILAPLACLGMIYVPLYHLFANPMLLQFLAGAVIARLWIQRALPSPRVGLVLALIGGLALVGTHWLGAQPDHFIRPFLWGAPSACLVLGLVAAEPILPRIAALRHLGDASYSIYLVHHSIMALVNRAMGPSQSVLFFCAASGVSIAAGLACHAAIERPLLARLRRPRGAATEAAAAP